MLIIMSYSSIDVLIMLMMVISFVPSKVIPPNPIKVLKVNEEICGHPRDCPYDKPDWSEEKRLASCQEIHRNCKRVFFWIGSNNGGSCYFIRLDIVMYFSY